MAKPVFVIFKWQRHGIIETTTNDPLVRGTTINVHIDGRPYRVISGMWWPTFAEALQAVDVLRARAIQRCEQKIAVLRSLRFDVTMPQQPINLPEKEKRVSVKLVALMQVIARMERDHVRCTQARIAMLLRRYPSSVMHSLKLLQERGLAEVHNKLWRLTLKGKQLLPLEDISGGTFKKRKNILEEDK